MESTSKVILALNALLEVNHRRFRHYNALVEKSDESDLKKIFQLYARRSTDFMANLNQWRAAYGLAPYTEKKVSLFSVSWSQMKDAFGFIERDDILNQCEIIEKDALKLYKSAIDLSFLPSEAALDIQKQIGEFERACATLKTMKTVRSSYVMSRAVA